MEEFHKPELALLDTSKLKSAKKHLAENGLRTACEATFEPRLRAQKKLKARVAKAGSSRRIPVDSSAVKTARAHRAHRSAPPSS